MAATEAATQLVEVGQMEVAPQREAGPVEVAPQLVVG